MYHYIHTVPFTVSGVGYHAPMCDITCEHTWTTSADNMRVPMKAGIHLLQ